MSDPATYGLVADLYDHVELYRNRPDIGSPYGSTYPGDLIFVARKT